MQKNLFLAAAAAALITGATFAVPAQASMTCQEAAKAKSENIKDRVTYKRECKKAYKAAHGKEGALSKLNVLKDRS